MDRSEFFAAIAHAHDRGRARATLEENEAVTAVLERIGSIIPALDAFAQISVLAKLKLKNCAPIPACPRSAFFVGS